MKYIINMINSDGTSKIKYVEAYNVEEATLKAAKKYPSYKVTRIATIQEGIDYYALMKNLKD